MATAAEQARRNREILAARLEGKTATEIALDTGLTPSRVRQILAAGAADFVDGSDSDPVQLAFERRSQLEELYDEARALIKAIPESNPSPKVGAVRAAQAALGNLIEWERYMGLLPPREGQAFARIDYRRMVDHILGVADDFGVGPEFGDRLLARLESGQHKTVQSNAIEGSEAPVGGPAS